MSNVKMYNTDIAPEANVHPSFLKPYNKTTFTKDQWKQIDQLCAIHCTGEEIAAIMEVSFDTLSRLCNESHGVNFAEYFNVKSANGKMSLRRRQYTMAMDGNATLQIWLGKQWLKQSDQQEINHSGDVKAFVLAYPVENEDKVETDSE